MIFDTLLKTSPYFAAIGVAWLVAHCIKMVLAFRDKHEMSLLSLLFISGGMPSSHAAVVVALWTLLVLTPGVDPALLGLATAFVLVVCYDAVKVRRSVGEQGVAIQELIKKSGSPLRIPRSARGHTPLEVMIGAIIGVLVGAVVYSTMI